MTKLPFLFASLFALSVLTAGCTKPVAFADGTKHSKVIAATAPRFSVTIPAGKLATKTTGRLLLMLAPGSSSEDLRGRLDDVEASRNGASFGTDATLTEKGGTVTVNPTAKTVRAFPLDVLAKLAPGTYQVQAAFAYNLDLRDTDAPGNLYSVSKTVTLPTTKPIAITLSEQEPEAKLPTDTDSVRFVTVPSPKLSRFYKRPMFLHAGVVLPSDYSDTPAKPYPLCVRIGGFHTRYTSAQRSRPYAGIVQVLLDGDGPFGDSYSTNSAVAGPYGDATIQELLPEIEKQFHCGGSVSNRFTTGGSTGGWVSLALQVYYPDTFGGCWSGYPDPLDFRAYQATDLTKDANAYLAPDGSEQTSCRDVFTGAAKWSVREECALENVRGFGGSYVTSGGQWGAWNSVWGQRDKKGHPIPFWDPVTGKINRTAANAAGKQYDLRRYCAAHWKTLAPKLEGKLHIWVGERDDYFLNGGVHKFDAFLKTASPKITARVEYSPIGGHGWEPRSRAAVLDEMIATAEK